MGELEPTPEQLGLDPSETGEEEKEDQITVGEKEIKLEDGESMKFPTLEVERMHLFIGKTESGLGELPEAYETTVGDGVYLTSQREAAEGYAIRRSNGGDVPTVYEAEIQNLSLLDLTTYKTQEIFADYFKEQLLKWREQELPKKEYINEPQRNRLSLIVDQVVERIKGKSFGGMRDLTFTFGFLVRDLLTREGFDGLKIEEGGEGRGEIGNHDSYVIFNPQQVKIIKESKV